MASDSSLSSSLEGVREWLRKSINGEKWKNDQNDDGDCSEISSSYQESWSERGSVSELDEPVQSLPHQDRNQDRNKPFYVPRKPHFFEHDLRILDEEDDDDDDDDDDNNNNKKYMTKEEDHDYWTHDLFNSELQKPKSKQEIIDYYGYDIRSDSPSFVRYKTRDSRQPQFECHDQGYKFKQRTDDVLEMPSSPPQQKEPPPASPKNKFDLEAKIKGLTIEKSKGSSDRGKAPFSKSNFKLEPKSTVNRVQDTCTTLYPLIKEESDRAPVSASIISSSPTLKAKDRPSGALPAKFTGSIEQSKIIDVNQAKPSNNIPLVNNHEVISSIGRGRAQNKSTNLLRGPEVKNPTAIVPLRKDTGGSYSVAKAANFYSNYQGSMLTSKCQNVINTTPDIESEENVISPTQVLNTDAKFLDSKAVISTCTGGTVPPNYRYYSDYVYGVNDGENFLFPAPPDLSASHLTPYIPQHQYYFTNTHPHQNFEQAYDSPLQWCYYTQSSCYQGTTAGIAYLKQHNGNNWPNSLQVGHLNQLVTSPQHLDVNPYYSLHTEGVRCLSPSPVLPVHIQNVNFLD